MILPLWSSLNCDFICDSSNEEAYKITTEQMWHKLVIYGSYGKTALANYMQKNFNYCIINPQINLIQINENIIWDFIPSDFNSELAFHLWNISSKKLIIIMENHPLATNIMPNDLKTRLAEAICVKIYPPTRNLKMQIFKSWFKFGGLIITDTVLNFFFSLYNDSLPILYQRATIIYKYSCKNQKEITIHTIQNCSKLW